MRVRFLLALPDREETFREHVLWSDFLGSYGFRGVNGSVRREDIGDVWRYKYGPTIGAAVAQLAEAVRDEEGMSVRQHVTLADVADGSRKADAVVVLAHWKGAEVKGEDVKSKLTVSQLRAIVGNHDNPLARWVEERAGPIGRRGEQSVCAILNEAITVECGEEGAQEYPFADVVMEDEGIRRCKRRALLDVMLADYLVPGNRIELFDGPHDAGEVVGALPSDFGGILDLTTCHSTYLAQEIRRRRKGRVRTVAFPYAQDPVWACTCLKVVVKLVGLGVGYVAARECAIREQIRAVEAYKAEK